MASSITNSKLCKGTDKPDEFQQPILQNKDQIYDVTFWNRSYDYRSNDNENKIYSGVCNTHLLDSCENSTHIGICNPNILSNSLTLHFKSNKIQSTTPATTSATTL